MLSEQEVLAQSKGAFKQWEATWRNHSKINGELFKSQKNGLREYLGYGAGKTALLLAMGASLEKNISIIKKYSDKEGIDILCVDKCFKYLMREGIKPKMVLLCDAGIDYDRWCKEYIEHTKGIILVSNINANTKWTKNWKGEILFFVNKDNIQSEKIFSEISGCMDQIPAGSNVSNSLVIFATGILNYDRYLLCGYDYSWNDEKNYYAFCDNEKRYSMKHIIFLNQDGNQSYTSNNLDFSSKWITDFYLKMLAPRGIKIYNCCGGYISNMPTANLEKMLQYVQIRNLNEEEKKKLLMQKAKKEVINDKNGGREKLQAILDSGVELVNVEITYIDEGAKRWLN